MGKTVDQNTEIKRLLEENRQLKEKLAREEEISLQISRHQESLRESESRLATFAAATFEGIVRSKAGHVIDCNEQFAKMLGYTVDELKGMAINDFLPPEDRERILENISKGRESHIEHELIRKDGSRILVEAHGKTFAYDTGTRHTAVRDITARKKAEKQLIESRNQLQSIINNTPAVIYLLDLQERFVLANKVIAELFNSTPENMLGKKRQEFIPKEIAREHEENDRKIIETGRALQLEEHGDFKGKKRIYLSTKFPLRDSQGKIYAVAGISTDITERKLTEELLRQNETKYRSLFENMLDGSAYCQMLFNERGQPVDFIYLEVNPAFSRQTGLKNIIGKRATEVIPGIKDSNPELLEIYGRVAATGQPEKFEIELKALQAWFSITAYSPSRNHFVAIFDNITERKQTEANQLLMAEILRILNRGGGDLHQLIGEILRLIRESTGFDAVGLRMRKGEDYPYFEQNGFSEEFLKEENFLCEKHGDGSIIRDADGRVTLECTCGLVLSGRTDPSMPCFTKAGSFWTNVSSDLLALTPETDPRTNPRNRCIHIGYQSVGLFPVRSGEETIGLLQLNGRREGLFNPEMIRFFESLGDNLGLGLKRKQAEEALRESEERFRTAFEAGSIPMALTALDTKIMKVNSAFCKMMGFAEEELVNHSFTEITHPDDLAANLAGLEPIIKGQKNIFRMEKRYIRKDGAIIWGDMSTAAVRDIHGKPLYIVTHVQDITKRKKAEEALRNERQRLAAILETVPSGVVLYEKSEKISFINSRAVEIFGKRPPDNIKIKDIPKILQIYTPEGELFESEELGISRALNGEIVHQIEAVVKRPDGTSISALSSAAPLRDEEGEITAAVAAFMDVSELKKLTEALKESNADLQQFAHVASHDLREPLRMITGFLQLLKTRYGDKLNEKGNEYVNHSIQGAERMGNLLNDLLSYSRVESKGKVLLPFDVQHAINLAIANLKLAIEETDAKITIDEMPQAKGDALQISQLFQNLIANAIKFHGDKKPEIHIGCKRQDNSWLFWVKDNGIGIDPKFFDRIFMIFQRLHTREKYGGTGVGLAICKKIIERHGGSIRVESQAGAGSTFYFTLPAAD